MKLLTVRLEVYFLFTRRIRIVGIECGYINCFCKIVIIFVSTMVNIFSNAFSVPQYFMHS